VTRVAKLGDFLARKTRGIVPNSMPDERFELYSVPSFEEKVPELVAGHEIGSNKQIVEPGTKSLQPSG
jgi:type I restriction enzyme S subunit